MGPGLAGGTSPVRQNTSMALSLLAGLSYAAYSLIGGKLITGGHSSARSWE